jgi:hypothetical protein
VNSRRELLALRREVLVARSSLQRLKIGRDVDALRESLQWPRALRAVTSTPQGRSLLFGMLLLVTGSGRLARMVRMAAAALAVAKLGAMLLRAAKAPAADAQDARSEPTSAASSHSSEPTS